MRRKRWRSWRSRSRSRMYQMTLSRSFNSAINSCRSCSRLRHELLNSHYNVQAEEKGCKFFGGEWFKSVTHEWRLMTSYLNILRFEKLLPMSGVVVWGHWHWTCDV